ncbi:aldehyde dehydrogenase family protein, partial [Rhizobium leguminosarum]
MKQYSLFIGGARIETATYADVRNPSTGEVVGQMPLATAADLDLAVAAASVAFRTWSQASEEERQAACRAIAEKIAANGEELARLLTLEQGKP